MSYDINKLYGVPENYKPNPIIKLTVQDIGLLRITCDVFATDLRNGDLTMTHDEVLNWMKLKSHLPDITIFSNELLESIRSEEIEINLGDLDIDSLLSGSNALIICICKQIDRLIQEDPNDRKGVISFHCGIVALSNFSMELEMIYL